MSLDIFIVSVLPNALMHLCITGVDLLRERISIIRALMSKSSIVGCLGCSLGQAPTSAKSDTDWIHFVTPRHRSDTLFRFRSAPDLIPPGLVGDTCTFE